MARKRHLVRTLQTLDGFDSPKPELEQYRTPPELAASLIHTADLQGDITDCLVVDLGCGTGMLALGAALRGPRAVVGVDVDGKPLSSARENERRLRTRAPVSWVRGDVRHPPLANSPSDRTVVMNPPFGAQAGNEHADREFLRTARDIASVSYSIHNEGSLAFVEGFASDNGGEVTHALGADFDIPRVFDFHSETSKSIDVEVFRIDWSETESGDTL